ncbi:hypothetical protein [uncultured Friedmanniella sp.]|uniref:hypothetical protein n=1 Tax=uncultured Friedmanniella sp. TaxID=335381 RepID=UPI0035CAA483
MNAIEELVVPYDPTELVAAVDRRRRTVRSRLISLGITVVILVLLYAFGGTRLQGAGFLAVYGLALVVSLAWFVGSLLIYLRVRSELGTLGSGTAVRIGRPGVQVAGVFAPWSEVAALVVVSGGLARSPRLELRRTTGEAASVALNQIVVHPATLDSTARAYSAGRHGVDLTALES